MMKNDQDINPCLMPASTEEGSRYLYGPGAIMDDSFSFDGYQVVRGEYFAHVFEPSVTFNDYKISVNKACANRLPSVDYVQILVSRNEKKLLIKPCDEWEKGSFLWCIKGIKERRPRTATCRILFAMIMRMMEWNPGYRYKLLGKLIVNKGEYLFVFDLTEPEIYQRLLRDPETGKVIKPGSSKPMYPDDWKDQFGLSVEDNRKSLQINIFNGYAVYGLSEKHDPEIPSLIPNNGEGSVNL